MIQQKPNLEELEYGGVEGLPPLGLLRLLVDTAQAQHFPLLHACSASRWVRAPAQPFLQLLPTPANRKWQWIIKEHSGVMPYIFVDTLCWRLFVFVHQLLCIEFSTFMSLFSSLWINTFSSPTYASVIVCYLAGPLIKKRGSAIKTDRSEHISSLMAEQVNSLIWVFRIWTGFNADSEFGSASGNSPQCRYGSIGFANTLKTIFSQFFIFFIQYFYPIPVRKKLKINKHKSVYLYRFQH